MYRRSINSAVKLAVQIANTNHHWLEKTDWKFHKSTHNIKINLPLHSFTKINSMYFLGFARVMTGNCTLAPRAVR